MLLIHILGEAYIGIHFLFCFLMFVFDVWLQLWIVVQLFYVLIQEKFSNFKDVESISVRMMYI